MTPVGIVLVQLQQAWQAAQQAVEEAKALHAKGVTPKSEDMTYLIHSQNHNLQPDAGARWSLLPLKSLMQPQQHLSAACAVSRHAAQAVLSVTAETLSTRRGRSGVGAASSQRVAADQPDGQDLQGTEQGVCAHKRPCT